MANFITDLVSPPNSFTDKIESTLTTSPLREPGNIAIQNTLSNSINDINGGIPSAPGINSGLLSNTISNSIGQFSSGLPFSTSKNSPGDFKVRLVSVLDLTTGTPSSAKRVVFEVTPTLSESQSVEYASVQPIHMPGGIQVYKFTNPRQFEISAHFISRNTSEALTNIKYLQTLRSWSRPFFGLSSTRLAPKPGLQQAPSFGDRSATGIAQIQGASLQDGVNLLGAPPEVLYLYGYSTVQNDARQGMAGINLNRIPVVLTSLNISYAEDIDYIPVSTRPNAHTEPFPVKIDVSITLVETHSPAEYEKFSLDAFKSGTLKSF